ncbi:MAG: sugar transporter substrate-binding protein [Marmoricola sp.]|nr:sugar transporter substrate-binding protein [Marmoricola sp.]
MRPSLKALLAVPLLVLGLTTGCGNGDADNVRTTITYWANPAAATPEQHLAVLEPLLKRFTKNTGIKVKVEMQDWTKVYPKIVTGIANDSLPDVFDTGATWAAALQATGGLKEFGAADFDALGGRDRFLASSLAATGVPGPTSAVVPFYGQAYGLVYNPKLFTAAGIKAPPTTWDEFVADANKLTRKGQWGVAFGGAGPLLNVHQAFILGRQEGAQLFSASGKPTFDTPQERAGVRRLLDLMAVDKVIDPSMIEKNGVDMALEFAKGKTGMMFAQSAVIGLLKSVSFSDYAVAEVPVPQPLAEGGSPVQSIVAGTNLAVSATSEHAEAALELVKYLTSDAVQVTVNQAFGTLPVLTSLQGAPDFADPALAVFAQIQARHSEPMPLVPAEFAMEQVLGPELVSLWPKAADGSLTDDDIGKALRKAQAQLPKS